jgi:hypothetical protein
MSLAVVVIASEKRMNTTFPLVMQSVLSEQPDEIVCVADFYNPGPWKHIQIPVYTRTTLDALIKRDVGFVATQSDSVMYLSDDHVLTPGFVQAFRDHEQEWDILVPTRWCMKYEEKIGLNMGQATNYCAGHGGIYRRRCGHTLPWTATIPHPNWDVIHSHHLIANGCVMKYTDKLFIQDIEPGAQPWM